MEHRTCSIWLFFALSPTNVWLLGQVSSMIYRQEFIFVSETADEKDEKSDHTDSSTQSSDDDADSSDEKSQEIVNY